MTWTVTSDVIATVRAEATLAGDRECCGLLLGRGRRIERAQPAANVAGDPRRHFEIDPAALLAAHRAARSGGAEVLGYYHSHPAGPAAPSAIDREHASGDSRLWAIIARSGQGRGENWGEVAFWQDRPGGFVPADVRLAG